MKRFGKMSAVLALTFCMSVLGACANGGNNQTGAASEGSATKAGTTITLGFSQVGAESGWRSANTKSIQDSAKEAGYNLKFSDRKSVV